MSEGKKIDGDAASSTGQLQTEANYLDNHFVCMQPEYEATLLAAGIQPGWRVLDAGAGGGSFLPLMSTLVGRDGKIDALDLAPENVEMIERRMDAGDFAAPVFAKKASILDLPFEDDAFDMVWCANVMQYLSEDELELALKEFYRVTKPGGWVAIKEVDLDAYRAVGPLDPLMFRRLIAGVTQNPQIEGVLRTTLLPRWLRQTGFEQTSFQSFTCERAHPLDPTHLPYLEVAMETWCNVATASDISESDKKEWERCSNSSDNFILNDVDFYYREAWGLVKGRVPLQQG